MALCDEATSAVIKHAISLFDKSGGKLKMWDAVESAMDDLDYDDEEGGGDSAIDDVIALANSIVRERAASLRSEAQNKVAPTAEEMEQAELRAAERAMNRVAKETARLPNRFKDKDDEEWNDDDDWHTSTSSSQNDAKKEWNEILSRIDKLIDRTTIASSTANAANAASTSAAASSSPNEAIS